MKMKETEHTVANEMSYVMFLLTENSIIFKFNLFLTWI